MTNRISLFLASFAATICLSACSSLEFPWVYKISVQQGNILDQEDIDKLEVGMTKRQVRFVMGSPLMADTFNPNRWDYYYSRRSGDGKTKKETLTIFFENDKYVRHSGTKAPQPKPKPDESSASSGQNSSASH